MKQENKKLGFNLVEAAIVLGVVGLIIGGIWVAASSVQQNMRINRAGNDVGIIVNNLRNMFKGQNFVANSEVYASWLNPNLNSAIFPADALSGTNPINPWGMRYRAAYNVNGTVPGIFVDIMIPDVATCAKLITRLHQAYKSDLDAGIAFADARSEDGGGGYSYGSGDFATITNECQDSADASGGTQLYITFATGL